MNKINYILQIVNLNYPFNPFKYIHVYFEFIFNIMNTS